MAVGIHSGAAPAHDAYDTAHLGHPAPQAAAELALEVGLLTRALFAGLRSDAAQASHSTPTTGPEWSVDAEPAAGSPGAPPVVETDLEVPALVALELGEPSPSPGAATGTLSPPTASLLELDLPTLGVVPQADAADEEQPTELADGQDFDEDEPDVLVPRLAHLRDLRVLDEIRFLED